MEKVNAKKIDLVPMEDLGFVKGEGMTPHTDLQVRKICPLEPDGIYYLPITILAERDEGGCSRLNYYEPRY